MRRRIAILTVLALCGVAPLPASAQANAPAELMMVKKGVFTLKVGQSIDVTDRGILLHMSKIRAEAGASPTGVSFSVNGQGGTFSVGYRMDLKRETSTKDFVKDMRGCFLDLVSAVAPVGAAATATFRLLCE
jgi:hypothetical protein